MLRAESYPALMSARRLPPLLLLLLGALPLPADAAPELSAARVSAAIEVDGKLDETVWKRAPTVTRFVQRSPAEGKAPAQRTSMWVLHDAGAVYVGLRMYDSEPGLIRGGLGRRDNPPDSDNVIVFIDPVGSGKRGYWFKVNVSGILSDGVLYQENIMDDSWNGVWSGAAAANATGWTAEFRIPLTSIAYQDLDEQTWGFHVQRYIQRIKETSTWPPMPKSSNTFVSRFGKLRGLRRLERTAAVRLLPYVGGEFQLGRHADSLRPDDTFRPNSGLDMRYSFSGGGSLSVTINPDFGQVEEDPAVINLSPNEIFWAEKRPFFVEGASLFNTPIKLLHTRRIGARPSAPEAGDGGEIVEVAPETRIGGAVKLVGDAGPASFGLLSTFVLPAYAREKLASGKHKERTAAPALHYGAGRLLLRPWRRASLGVLFTAMTHLEDWDRDDAYAGGVDWDLRTGSGWQTRGQLSASVADPGSGYGLMVTGGQMGGRRWRYWVTAESFSEDYQINDLGYQWRNDMVRTQGYVQHLLPRPWKFLRELHVTVWGLYGFKHSDPEIVIDRLVELNTFAQFSNHWEIWTGGGFRFDVLDDRETRGGLVYPKAGEGWFWFGAKTDSTRQVYAEATYIYAQQDDGVYHEVNGAINAALWDRLNCTLFFKYHKGWGYPRWVETVTGSGRDQYIFGDLNLEGIDVRLSALLGITHLITFQVFVQLLYTIGTYDSYQELYPLDDGAGALAPTPYDAAADFTALTLQANAVLRWDLGAGAAAYLVYKLSGDLSRSGGEVKGFNIGPDVEDLLDEEQSHLLQVKLSYGWDM